ncbi:MAG: polysaccharide deacetylase family protein [Planctomycetota bacterium]|nr:polysaccharide deacetylase family protein [Planctomycetota bacterium]
MKNTSHHATLLSFIRPAVAMTVFLLLTIATTLADEKTETWAEKLGYGPDARVIILHADDLGMCPEANAAGKKYLDAQDIQSASAMVPCPNFDEFAAWFKENPQHDCGLHITLNSEWKRHRWGPVAPRDKVPGLVDSQGKLHRGVLHTAMGAKASEVETEIRAQIDHALATGIKPTHLDTHMGTLYARVDFAEAFLKVAQEYKIPAFVIDPSPVAIIELRKHGVPMTRRMRELIRQYPGPKLDMFDSVPKGKSYEEVREKFFALVRGLRPGITEILFHPSVKSEALKKITGSWQQRVWESQLFADPEVKKSFKDEGIQFTTWREMGERYKKRQAAGGN